MAITALSVKNQALAAINSRVVITDPAEQSVEREVCDLWYETVVETVQSAAHFPSSKVELALARVRENGAASGLASAFSSPHYLYAYEWPVDCLHPWYLTTYEKFSTGFDVATNTKLIYCNSTAPVLVYAKRQDTVRFWELSERNAIIYGLAAAIAGPLTGKAGIISRNHNLANNLLEVAQMANSNIDDVADDFVPSHLMAAGYSLPSTTTRFIHPYGALFGIAASE